MIIKRAIAVESLTKVCEESLGLIKQMIEADNEVYAKGYEDGMAAESEVQKTLRPWIGLTDEEILVKCESVPDYDIGNHDLIQFAKAIEAKLMEKNR
jgi:hypothetical protein